MCKLRSLVAWCTIFLAAAVCARAGAVSGALLDPRGLPCAGVVTSSSVYGDNPLTGPTVSTAADGSFALSGLPAGTCTQGFSEKSGFPLIYRKGIEIPVSGDPPWSQVVYRPTAYTFGTEDSPTSSTAYHQSFRATGTSVASVKIRCTYSEGTVLAISVLNSEGPSGAQVGPTRYVTAPSTGPLTAYWSAGQVPTVPGSSYTVRIVEQSGSAFRLWRQTVYDRMRSENPDGKTWVGGVLASAPVEMTVTQDDAGTTHTMLCADAAGYLLVNQQASQTFTARGGSLVVVTWRSDHAVRWRISVHDGVFGPQIGPARYVYAVALNRSIATWDPNEVPTIPGHVYCVNIAPAASQNVSLYYATDTCAGGSAYVGAAAQTFDWALGIYEDSPPGAVDQPSVEITDLRVESVTASSALVRWSTGSRASGSTVEYGESTPYPASRTESALVTDHAVTVTGLKANTMYHIRARSAASGCREGVSPDLVFVTAPAAPNLLNDPGFESGVFSSWTKFGTGDIRLTGSWTGGSGPRTGNRGLAGAAANTVVNGGAYQRVPATSGAQYRLSAWLYTHCVGDFFSRAGQTVCRIGIDPSGGTNPNSAGVVWTPYACSQDQWTHVGIAMAATASYVTVFLSGGSEQSIESSAFSFDDVVLSLESGRVDVTLNQTLTACADGTDVRIAGVVCTATPAQAGAYYVEDSLRTNGLRVETADAMLLGERTTVLGTVRTKASGERYLASATVSSRASGTPLRPLCTALSRLGGRALGAYCPGVPGTVGPYNVGMLFRAAGTVRSTGSGFIYVNDGSLPGNGLKVSIAGLGAVPAVGKTVAITGIVQLEGTAGSATVLLRPRADSDVRVF